MKVPILDLRPQHENLREELLTAIGRVLDSQQFVLGPEVQKFEEELAAYAGSKHAIGCASGSDALLLALMALNIGPGDEVITSPFTFFATGAAITRLGARPVFVDIDPSTYTIDVARVESAITERTRAIIPVHLYGQCADLEPLLEISRRHGLSLVEDAAQAIGALDRNRQAGTAGVVGCFSFYPSKNLGAAGDAGAMIANDSTLAERLRKLRVHGQTTEYYHSDVGINSRLDALQAAVLRVKLKHLEGWSEGRRKNASYYTNALRDCDLPFEVRPPSIRPQSKHIFHQYVVRVPGFRDQMMNHLAECGVGTRVYYPVPLHLLGCFAYLGHHKGDFPEAEAAALETMALPCFPELTERELDYVIDSIKKFRA